MTPARATRAARRSRLGVFTLVGLTVLTAAASVATVIQAGPDEPAVGEAAAGESGSPLVAESAKTPAASAVFSDARDLVHTEAD